MSEIEIRSLNGHKLVDETARQMIVNLPEGEPDWNAKEGEEGYIKNRTHWINNDYQEIQIETTRNMYNGIYYGEDVFTFSLPKVGVPCKIKFDNEEFSCIPYATVEYRSSIFIGSIGFLRATGYNVPTYDNGEANAFPFLIQLMLPNSNNSEMPVWIGLYSWEQTNHTIGFYETDIQKIDDKFLPKYAGSFVGVKTIGNNEIFNNTENIASGYNNHVEGLQNEAYGHFIHNEGYKNKARGYYHHIEGVENNISQILQDVAGTHVEGTGNNAYGNYSHIEGMYNATYDSYSHVNGECNDSDGIASTVIGSYNLSSRENKRDRYTIAKEHSEKNFTTLNRTCYISRYEQSPIETFEPFWGFYYPQYETLTYNDLVVGDYFLDVLQSVTYNNYVNKVYHVISIEPGVSVTAEEYTLEDKWNHKDKLFVVGNGTDWDNHSNAHTLDWDGNAWYSGDVYVGSTSGTNKDEGSKKLATEEYVAEEIANIGNTLALHPIGSIYMSVNETSPAELFGGTWEQLKNRFLLGTSDAHPLGETGGSETHTLTQAELPKLTGTAQFGGGSVGATEGGYGAVRTASGIFSGVNVMQYGRPTEATTGRYAQNTTSFRDLKIQFGSGKAHNNMPPYIAVNIWKRVA